jgi:programmed cell death protein 10
MGDETPVTSLILPVLIRPILSQLEKQDISASQTLRSALTKAEASYPGLTHDLVIGIMRKGDLTVNLNESILRLQGAASETDVVEYRLNRSEDAFQELNRKSAALKRILSRIPDEINDRKTFLETIKYAPLHFSFFLTLFHAFFLKGNSQCHQEIVGCRQRGERLYSGQHG